MFVQDLRLRSPSMLSDPPMLWRRRALFAVPVLGSAALGMWLAAQATGAAETWLGLILLALLAVNLLYVALTGWPMLIGIALHLSGRTVRVDARPSGRSRTALLMPIFNEDARAVFAAVETMGRALVESGVAGVDLFVLSDTQDEAIAARELAEFARTKAMLPAGPDLFYRRRAQNSGRKVGNILDFCRRWGEDYEYMLVMDADSLMGASAIERLIGLMDAHPKLGIVQTVPYAVGRETPFGRMLQFGARLYTPLLVEGLTFWQGGDGNYWGHNALIRIRPFVEHCGLPVLPGREPFGGEILCHDVVEAGLMRAAGWQVWVLPEVMESYEAVPANLVDFAGRERRWCQGNLQHTRVLPDRRLRPVGRFHLFYGILHYAHGPLLALFFALATADALSGGSFAEQLLSGSPASAALVALTGLLLYGGKIGTLLTVLADPLLSRRFGGRARLLMGAALEQVGALVISGVLMTFYTRFTAALLAGHSVRWDAQPRDDRGLSWTEACTRMALPTALGAAWLVALALGAPGLLLWASPFLAGMLGSAPAAYASSRVGLGRGMRRAGLFVIPEETAPTEILWAHIGARPAGAAHRPVAAPALAQLADAD